MMKSIVFTPNEYFNVEILKLKTCISNNNDLNVLNFFIHFFINNKIFKKIYIKKNKI